MKAKKLTNKEQDTLIKTLKNRFSENKNRHKGILWESVENNLLSKPSALWSLQLMEETGGEPDVVVLESQKNTITFVDCSAESPKGRRSLCYDEKAHKARKKHKPKDSAINMATEMGIKMLTEEQYRKLQTMGEFDTKTSTWVKTPDDIRKLGGALFCDRRYDTVFTYHNGAESYYASRGFRGILEV